MTWCLECLSSSSPTSASRAPIPNCNARPGFFCCICRQPLLPDPQYGTCHPWACISPTRKLGLSFTIWWYIPCSGLVLLVLRHSCCFYTLQKGWWTLKFASDWICCAGANSILVWVYFALDELFFFYLAETQRISPQQHPHLRKVSVSESNVLLDEEVLTDPKIQALLLTVLVSPLSVCCLLSPDILLSSKEAYTFLAVFRNSYGSESLWCASRFFCCPSSNLLGIAFWNLFKCSWRSNTEFSLSCSVLQNIPNSCPFFLPDFCHKLILYNKMIVYILL